jgi:hypothetical protein
MTIPTMHGLQNQKDPVAVAASINNAPKSKISVVDAYFHQKSWLSFY